MLSSLLLLAAATSSAHDFWLWPATFRPGSGSTVSVRAGVGEGFPNFSSPVALDRVEGLRLIGPAGERELAVFDAEVAGPGAYVIALAVKDRFIELKPADFQRYITEEEFSEVIETRRAAGAGQQPGREIYSRYSKLLLQVHGRGDDSAATQPVGHELEIIPRRNPARLKRTDELTVQVLFRGKPLANARVAAAPAGMLKAGSHHFPAAARTDSSGLARLRLDRHGPWLVRMIHMLPLKSSLDGKDADWRSFFATLVFNIEH